MSDSLDIVALRLAGLANRLTDTLQQELQSLESVARLVDQQLEALAQADYPRVEDLTLDIDTAVHGTADLREAHIRQAGLLFRVATGEEAIDPSLEQIVDILRDEPGHEDYAERIVGLIGQIRTVALHAARRRTTLEFSLLSAQRVGRGLLTGLHRALAPATTSVYTSAGTHHHASGGQTLLNKVG